MKVEIRIGEVNENSPRIKYDRIHLDDIELDKVKMYNILLYNDNCIIENVDHFLLYMFGNGLLAHHVKNEPNINDNPKYNYIPQLSPDKYKVFQIDQYGNEKQIIDEDGCLGKNHFDTLMRKIMDDFYVSLNYLN